MLAGDPAETGPQPLLVCTYQHRTALGGAMLAGDPARATLGHPEAGLQVPNGPAAPLRGQKFPSASSLSMSISSA
jgi:hypothetical protein